MAINFTTFNVNGLQKTPKRITIFNELKNNFKNGIFFLQETHTTPSDVPKWKKEWGKNILFDHGTSNARGSAILFYNVDHKILSEFSSGHGRLQIVALDVSSLEKKILLINIYNHNDENNQVSLLQALEKKLDDFPDILDFEIILGGDFNCTVSPDLDSKGGNPTFKRNSVSQINIIKNKFSLIDIFRTKYPLRKTYTWRRNYPVKMYRRLDFFLISNTLQDSIKSVKNSASTKSDHCPVSLAVIPETNVPRGPRLWRYNFTLNYDPEFCSSANSMFDKLSSDHSDLAPNKKFELFKYEFKKLARDFSIKKSKNDNMIEKTLCEKIKYLEEKADDNDFDELARFKQEYEAILDKKTMGMILRSRCQNYEHGEKSSKFFLNLEKQNATNNTIKRLHDQNGNIHFSQKKILEIIKDFYSELFTKKINVNEEHTRSFLNGLNLPKLTDEQRELCEIDFSLDDLHQSFKEMDGGKTPGNDGLTKEFFLNFWDKIGPLLHESLIQGKNEGSFSPSQNQSVIKLLPKKDKDKSYISNLRPISLVNVGLKGGSKTVASSLKKVLPTLINSDQTAYVYGRFIGESSRLISDIIEVTRNLNIGGYLVTMDIQKAFDSVDHDFLMLVLENANFGPNFLKWIKVLISNQQSSVFNSGFSTGYFNLSRGCRQGDPISAYLFILVIEVFFQMVRKNNDIKGLNILGFEFKLTSFADDSSFFYKISLRLKSYLTLLRCSLSYQVYV